GGSRAPGPNPSRGYGRSFRGPWCSPVRGRPSGLVPGSGRDQHRLDAVVALVDEDVVGVGHVFQRDAAGDHLPRGNVARTDVLDQPWEVAFHAGLVHAQGQDLVHRVADRNHVEGRSVDADDRNAPALACAVDRPVQGDGRAGLHHKHLAGGPVERAAGRIPAHSADAHVRAQPLGHLLQVRGHVVDLAEVDRLGMRELLRELQPVLLAVDHDHPPGAEEPRTLGREQADRAGTEHDHRVAFADAAHLRGLVAGGEGVGEQDRILDVDVIRDHGRADIGKGHAHVFGLAAVIAAGGVGVAVEATHRTGLRIDVVAVAVQLLLAEVAAAAEDVERHQHPVADLQVLHRRADLLHHAAELVADDRADPGIGYQAVVDVDVRPAYAGAGDAHDGVVRMLDLRFGDVRDAHGAR